MIISEILIHCSKTFYDAIQNTFIGGEMIVNNLRAGKIIVEPLSKIGFWFKVKAEPRFSPQAYSGMSRTWNEEPTQRLGQIAFLRGLLVTSLLLASICYSVDTNAGTKNTKQSDKAATITEQSGKNISNDEPEEHAKSSGLIPMDKLHEIIREERIATLLEIDKERKATLEYLTKERKATLEYLTKERRSVVEELIKETHRISDLLVSERLVTMVDLDTTGDQIIETAIINSEQLIDFIFIRLLQLAMVIILAFSILGFIVFRIMAKRKSQP